jgi:plasmid maintenance system antidote protein VapI
MTDSPYKIIGGRLEQLRNLLSDLTQKEWAEKHGFTPTQYNNWVNGGRRISIDAAIVLCDTYGLTLDYIYRGRVDGVPQTIRVEL